MYVTTKNTNKQIQKDKITKHVYLNFEVISNKMRLIDSSPIYNTKLVKFKTRSITPATNNQFS